MVNKEAPGKKPQKLRMGTVFGPTELFDTERENVDLVISYTATVTSGTVLRIKYSDLQRAKYGEKNNIDAASSHLSEDELVIRSVTQAGNVALTNDMNAFLRKSNLLALSHTDPSRKYIHYGSIGRQMPPQRKEQNVLFVLDGSIRVVLEKSILTSSEFIEATQQRSTSTNGIDEDDDANGGESSRHGEPVTMTCVREGEPSATFKV